jgi:hypothetical protein
MMICWWKRFARYRLISDLRNAPAKQQVDILVYCMGGKGEQLLESFKLNGADLSDFNKVLDKFEHYFIPKKHNF